MSERRSSVDKMCASNSRGIAPTSQEMEEVRKWAATRFEKPQVSELPFSFTYGGKSSADLLKTWNPSESHSKLDGERTEHTLTYTDPQSGLAVRCVGVEYCDFPTIEWTLYFENTGAADTPIIENIYALHMELVRGLEDEFVLHHNLGSM